MRKAKNALLSFVQRNTLDTGNIEGGSKFCGQHPEIHDDADVMKKAGKIRFTRIRVRNFLSEVTANECATEGVLPEGDGVDAAQIFGQRVENATGHCDITDALDSQRDDCSFQRLDLLPFAQDVHIDHVPSGIKGEIPNVLDDHRASDAAARITH